MLDRLLIGSFSGPKDPYFSNVTLLLHGDGSNGAQNNTFIDSSANNFTVTRNGNATQGSFSPFVSKPYAAAKNGGSVYFSGEAGNYLSVPNNAAFQFGTGNLTIEAWIYLTTDSIPDPDGNRQGVICSGIGATGISNDFWFLLRGNSTTTGTGLYFSVFNGGAGTTIFDTAYSFSKSTWYHVAFTRSGNNVYLFVNGSLIASSTYSGTITAGTNAVNIGYGQTGAANYRMPFPGYISNLRIVKGTAVYTAAFTPPTAPVTAISGTSLLINGINGAVIDSAAKSDLETAGNAQISTAVKKFGTGSIAFDGNGDYLYSAANSAFAFGTGDFTVEAWVYLNAATSTYLKPIAGTYQYTASLGDRGWAFGVSSGGVAQFYMGGSSGGGFLLTGATSLSTGQWYHLAVTRSGTSVKIFINGTQDASGTSSYNEDWTGAGMKVATMEAYSISPALGNSGATINGYIDDLRISKGVARYTANFTPPSAPFPDQ